MTDERIMIQRNLVENSDQQEYLAERVACHSAEDVEGMMARALYLEQEAAEIREMLTTRADRLAELSAGQDACRQERADLVRRLAELDASVPTVPITLETPIAPMGQEGGR
jgi:hypothetical protein